MIVLAKFMSFIKVRESGGEREKLQFLIDPRAYLLLPSRFAILQSVFNLAEFLRVSNKFFGEAR